ncbi:carboxyl transferase domain-containing protein, partial [Oleiphilus sp. HI0043]|uniref:carboxyl transferase domain-containing protein n=5 Tax=Oleiphilus TaxID=141450 RepID=UPI000A9CB294
MSILETSIETSSEEFQANAEAMQGYINEFRNVENKVVEKENQAKEKFIKRGKLLPRERINMLLDRGAPFLEVSSLAGYKMHDDKDGSMAGGGIIAGIGYVAGIRSMIIASNSAIKGGTISPAGLDKTLRLQEIAKLNKLPIVTLAESGGANLNYATDIFVQGARGFANQARLSAQGIPQFTVVHGNATAGGAYQPGLSDYTVVV